MRVTTGLRWPPDTGPTARMMATRAAALSNSCRPVPAVTVARTLTGTFAGIAWRSAPAFVAAQLVGAGLAAGTAPVLYPEISEVAA